MSLEQPPKNKMIITPPAKKEFHFAGSGIFHPMTIIAETIEEATKLWEETRRFVELPPEGHGAITPDTASPLSTTEQQKEGDGVQ
jgi:hypothetical protein